MADEGSRKGWMTQEQRDRAALERRRLESQPPADDDEQSEVTAPHTPIALERYHDDAAYRELWDKVSAFKRSSTHAQQAVGSSVLEVHAALPSLRELHDRIDKAEASIERMSTVLGITKWIAGFILAASLGSIVVVVTKIFSWGVSSGETEIRLQRVERDAQYLLERVGRSSHGEPTTKGAIP